MPEAEVARVHTLVLTLLEHHLIFIILKKQVNNGIFKDFCLFV